MGFFGEFVRISFKPGYRLGGFLALHGLNYDQVGSVAPSGGRNMN